MRPPDIPVLHDVAVKPYTHRAPHFYGGIDADKVEVNARILRGKGFRDRPEPIARSGHRGTLGAKHPLPKLEGQWVFGGPLWAHFGHVFTDSVHRFWPLISTPEAYDGVIFLGVKGLMGIKTDAQLAKSGPPAFVHDLMRALDLSHVKVRFITEPTIIESLASPRPGFALHGETQAFYRPFLHEFQTRITRHVAQDITTAPKRLYLGRNHLLPKGGILGSSFWQNTLTAKGFVAFKPEEHSLAQQFAHLIGAHTILMDEGSAAMPALILDQLEAEVLMFPRRAGRNPCQNMIGQRAAFTTLVPPDQMSIVPDRFGSTSSPGGLAVYNDPRAMFDDLANRGLISGTFDMPSYCAAEDADLEAANCSTDKIKQQRRVALNTARAARHDREALTYRKHRALLI